MLAPSGVFYNNDRKTRVRDRLVSSGVFYNDRKTRVRDRRAGTVWHRLGCFTMTGGLE